jgi:hypothetical protein
MRMGLTYDDGRAVLDAALDQARTALGRRLVGAFAVGSLAHGGFAPDVSDVDGVLIVDRADAAAAAAIRAIAVDGPLGERLSLFWGDYATFAAPPPETARLPPIVRLDLLRFGIGLYGDPVPRTLATPSTDDLIAESAAFAADRLAAPIDPAALVAAGRRTLTKAVLFPVRFLATACAGLAGSNDEAVAWYLGERRPASALAAAALAWRTQPVADPRAAEQLVARELPPLYRETIETYRNDPRVPAAERARFAGLLQV